MICFQELFYGPYFCQVQDKQFYDYAESIPGPTTERFQALAKELGMVMILPMYEEEQPGVLYNTAAVVDADGSYLGKYRKQHIPHVNGFWEKFYFRPGNGGYPVFDTAVGKIGVYICYDRHFPEGWRALGLNGAQIVFNPSATSRGLSQYLWSIEQPAAAVANEYYVGAINRVGIESLGDDDFYGQSYFIDPEGNYVGREGRPVPARARSSGTSTWACSPRCATAGSSTATVVRTPTATSSAPNPIRPQRRDPRSDHPHQERQRGLAAGRHSRRRPRRR